MCSSLSERANSDYRHMPLDLFCGPSFGRQGASFTATVGIVKQILLLSRYFEHSFKQAFDFFMRVIQATVPGIECFRAVAGTPFNTIVPPRLSLASAIPVLQQLAKDPGPLVRKGVETALQESQLKSIQ
jgi:hypothetical protein